MAAETKSSNPKDAVGTKKVPFSVIPLQVMAELGLALLEGALKYGRHNYRAVGVRASVYVDSTFRHLSAFWEGQDIDPDSGVSHVTKAIAGLVVLRDSMMQGNWVDDRPPRVADSNFAAAMNKQAAALIEKYPEPKAAFTQIDLETEEFRKECGAANWMAEAARVCRLSAGHDGAHSDGGLYSWADSPTIRRDCRCVMCEEEAELEKAETERLERLTEKKLTCDAIGLLHIRQKHKIALLPDYCARCSHEFFDTGLVP